ncbi:hypothetical protein SDC9_186511 [bioreactor metagenome]|uniref:Uncharacterized protein n=1 Tax=bioreactor metagenome TaxID=1076179 RepID=A0A645HK56_9ZZZZ
MEMGSYTIQSFLYFIKVTATIIAKARVNIGSTLGNLFAIRIFTIKNSERVTIKSTLACFTKFIKLWFEILF